MRKELKAVRRKNVALFSAGDQVLCYHEDALFRAEVLDKTNSSFHVHFVGWAKRFDVWTSATNLVRITKASAAFKKQIEKGAESDPVKARAKLLKLQFSSDTTPPPQSFFKQVGRKKITKSAAAPPVTPPPAPLPSKVPPPIKVKVTPKKLRVQLDAKAAAAAMSARKSLPISPSTPPARKSQSRSADLMSPVVPSKEPVECVMEHIQKVAASFNWRLCELSRKQMTPALISHLTRICHREKSKNFTATFLKGVTRDPHNRVVCVRDQATDEILSFCVFSKWLYRNQRVYARKKPTPLDQGGPRTPGGADRNGGILGRRKRKLSEPIFTSPEALEDRARRGLSTTPRACTAYRPVRYGHDFFFGSEDEQDGMEEEEEKKHHNFGGSRRRRARTFTHGKPRSPRLKAEQQAREDVGKPPGMAATEKGEPNWTGWKASGAGLGAKAIRAEQARAATLQLREALDDMENRGMVEIKFLGGSHVRRPAGSLVFSYALELAQRCGFDSGILDAQPSGVKAAVFEFYHKFKFLKVKALNGDRGEYTQGPMGAAGLGIYTPNYLFASSGDPNFPLLPPALCRARLRVATRDSWLRDRALSRLAAVEAAKRKARGEDIAEEVKEAKPEVAAAEGGGGYKNGHSAASRAQPSTSSTGRRRERPPNRRKRQKVKREFSPPAPAPAEDGDDDENCSGEARPSSRIVNWIKSWL